MNSIHLLNIQQNKRFSNLIECLCEVTDCRIERCKKHDLINILMISICAILGGANNIVAIAQFGEDHCEWFDAFLDLRNGIPSHDTFSCVFERIHPKELQFWLWIWLEGASSEIPEHISIDGKVLKAYASKNPLCIVRAWVHELQMVACSVKVRKKTNEIKAIPEILELLNLKGKIVTIDAIGAQKDIVKIIRRRGAEYLLVLKGNQHQFYKDVRDFMVDVSEENFENVYYTYYKTKDKNHGRYEIRECWSTEQINWLEQKREWKDLKSISMIKSTVTRNGKITISRRCFISSLPADAKKILSLVRAHWNIENQLHWGLDTDFCEDKSTIRKGHGPLNVSLIRSLGITLLKNSPINRSIQGKRALITCNLGALWKTLLNWAF